MFPEPVAPRLNRRMFHVVKYEAFRIKEGFDGFGKREAVLSNVFSLFPRVPLELEIVRTISIHIIPYYTDVAE